MQCVFPARKGAQLLERLFAAGRLCEHTAVEGKCLIGAEDQAIRVPSCKRSRLRLREMRGDGACICAGGAQRRLDRALIDRRRLNNKRDTRLLQQRRARTALRGEISGFGSRQNALTDSLMLA